jgi:hypothetical protein
MDAPPQRLRSVAVLLGLVDGFAAGPPADCAVIFGKQF